MNRFATWTNIRYLLCIVINAANEVYCVYRYVPLKNTVQILRLKYGRMSENGTICTYFMVSNTRRENCTAEKNVVKWKLLLKMHKRYI